MREVPSHSCVRVAQTSCSGCGGPSCTVALVIDSFACSVISVISRFSYNRGFSFVLLVCTHGKVLFFRVLCSISFALRNQLRPLPPSRPCHCAASHSFPSHWITDFSSTKKEDCGARMRQALKFFLLIRANVNRKRLSPP